MRITYLQIVKSLLINCSTFLIGIIVSAIIPIRFGHVLCPIAEPLQFRLKSVVMDIQMPVEMVLCHILLPTLIEKMHYKAVFKNVLKTYFKAMTQLLDLQWLASNEVFPETAAAAVVVVDHVDHPALLQNAPEVQHSVADSGPLVRAVESSPSTTAIYDEASLSSVDIGVTVTNTCHKKISSDDVCSAIVNDDEDEDDDNQHHSIESPIQQLPSSSIIATTSLSSITSCESSSDASITSIESSSDASIINNVTTNVLSSIKGTSETTRLSVFIVVGMILLATISSWLLHCPLTVGRRLIDMLHVSTDNDVFNYPVGLAFCGAIAFVLNFIVQDLVLNRDVVGVMNVVWKWSVRALQFVLVGMYWLVVPPFMLGIIFESLFLNPIRGNTSVFSFSLLECWAFGLIGLKIWTQCVLVGLFGDIDMRVSLEVIVMRGFAQFDAWYCIRSVIIPVSLRLLDYSLVPYLVSLTIQKGANHFFFIPVAYIPFIDHFHHWRYHVYVALRIVIFTCETTYKYIIRIHRQVRDSKYLIGTQLHNRPNGDPPMTLPLGVSTIPPPSSSSSSPSPSLLEQQAVVTSSSSSSSPIVDI